MKSFPQNSALIAILTLSTVWIEGAQASAATENRCVKVYLKDESPSWLWGGKGPTAAAMRNMARQRVGIGPRKNKPLPNQELTASNSEVVQREESASFKQLEVVAKETAPTTRRVPIYEVDRSEPVSKIQWINDQGVMVQHGEILYRKGEVNKVTLLNFKESLEKPDALPLQVLNLKNGPNDLIVKIDNSSDPRDMVYRFLNPETMEEVRSAVRGYGLRVIEDLIAYHPPGSSRSDVEIVKYKSTSSAPMNLSTYQLGHFKIQLKGDSILLTNPADPKAVAMWSGKTSDFHQFKILDILDAEKDFQFAIGNRDKRTLVFAPKSTGKVSMAWSTQVGGKNIGIFYGSKFKDAEKLNDQFAVFRKIADPSGDYVLRDFNTNQEYEIGNQKPVMLNEKVFATLDLQNQVVSVHELGRTGSITHIQDLQLKNFAAGRIENFQIEEGTGLLTVTRLQGRHDLPTTEVYDLINGQKLVWSEKDVAQFAISPDGKRIAFSDRDNNVYIEELTTD